MTVAVTGASGYVGANLVRQLIARGRPVRALVHSSLGELEGLDIETAQVDVREPETLPPALEGVDVVYHLAAIISITGDRGGLVPAVNVDGVGNVAQAALDAGVKRFVHFSSVHAFDLTARGRPIDEDSPRPPAHHPAYDRSKAAGEARLRAVIDKGLDAVIVNPTGVMGPRDPAPSRIGVLFRDVLRRRMPALVNGGFNWVDVRDLIDTAMRAEELGVTGRNYLVGGRWGSVRELADVAARCAGVRPPLLTLPMPLLELVAPLLGLLDHLIEGEPVFTREALHALKANRVVDDGRARRELGHRPRPLEETIADLVEQMLADAREPAQLAAPG